MRQIKLHSSWLQELESEFDKPYMLSLKVFLTQEKNKGKIIYPVGEKIFNALNTTHFNQVKVVIIGQDPYHGANQAHGLCFSVNKNTPIPPSLRNIYKEMQADIGLQSPNHGYLQSWARQGVLLLNSVLTVNQSQAGSHQGKGWENFTDRIIQCLNKQHTNIVYMLWGAYAQKKGVKIDANNNLILKSVHPSPLSAHRGFFGCKHFSKCNNYLNLHGKAIINWQSLG
ncbi:MAG: uracil-DNA glycosylase [Proteobacteria bacterium]|nr:uracil-DNA glycosylase [Pseudomonadota bacterium]